MEISSAKWISEMGMEDSTLFNQQYQMNPFDDYSVDGGLNLQCLSSHDEGYYYPKSSLLVPDSNSSYIEASSQAWYPITVEASSQASCCTIEHITPKASPASSSQIISFENSTSSLASSQQVYGLDYAMMNIPMNQAGFGYQGSYTPEEPKRVSSVTRSRSPLHAQDHVIAERKRREKLNQRFIALSALVPGLKKKDKVSILGDSIKYLKQLQEHVKTLEEQATKKTMESAIIVKKSHMYTDNETSSTSDHEDFDTDQSKLSNLYIPEIEARVSDRDVLIRIHCKKNKGHLSNILSEIENLHLTVISSNVFPFGISTLHITVVAKMNVESDMTVKELVKNLQLALLKLIMHKQPSSFCRT